MKAVLLSLFLLVGCSGPLLQLPAPVQPSPSPPPVDLMEQSLNATVALVNAATGRSYCSGVMWEHKVLTAAHCVTDEDGEQELEIAVAFRHEEMTNKYGYFFTDHRYIPVHVDDVQDFAVLGAAEPVPAYLYENIQVAATDPGTGSTVVVIGHPNGFTYTVTEGIVSSPRREEWEGRFAGQIFMQISAPVWYGNSGGPVFTRYGELVGITSFHGGIPTIGGVVHPEIIRAYTSPTTAR